MPEIDLGIANQIKTSVEYVFRPGAPVVPEVVAARNKLAAETAGIKESLLKMVAGVAREAAREGIFSQEATALQKRIRTSLWQDAAYRVQKSLSVAAEQGNTDKVMAVLNEIDPFDVPVNIQNSKPGDKPKIYLRRSVGLPPNSQVNFIQERPSSNFPDSQQQRRQIIVGARTFDKAQVANLLAGNNQYQPMWMKNGTLLPLTDETGQIFLIKMTHQQAKYLASRVVETIFIPEEPTVPAEKLRLIQNFVINPETIPVYINSSEIKYGASSLASPDHQLEDTHGAGFVKNNRGETVALRFIGIDGSGGSLPENQRHLIVQKVASIKTDLIISDRLNAKAAIETAHRNALATATQNPAYAGVVIVDVYPDKIDIARKGDHSVVLWKPTGYAHRRGEAWGKNRGGPSSFQSVDVPQNLAYSLKATEGPLDPQKTLTGVLEDTGGSDLIWSAVGMEKGGGVGTATIHRENISFEYLLILSDGARGSGALLDPAVDYSRSVNQIMIQLFSGQITEVETAKQICRLARQIPGETDDITVQIVKIPMPSPA